MVHDIAVKLNSSLRLIFLYKQSNILFHGGGAKCVGVRGGAARGQLPLYTGGQTPLITEALKAGWGGGL